MTLYLDSGVTNGDAVFSIPQGPYADFAAFAQKNFLGGVPYYFTRKDLKHQLLRSTPDECKKHCIAIWKVLLKFTGDSPIYSSTERTSQPLPNMGTVMNRLYDRLGISPTERDKRMDDIHPGNGHSENAGGVDPEVLVRTLEKKASRKAKGGTLRRLTATLTSRFFRADHQPTIFHTLPLEDTLRTPLEQIHFIVGYGILKPELRDDIYCMVCKQIVQNPYQQGLTRAWTLFQMMTACFPPSNQYMGLIVKFLDDSPPMNSTQCKRNIQKSLQNGTRFQPPSLLELDSVIKKIPLEVTITTMDGSTQPLVLEPGTTAKELTSQLMDVIGLNEQFGFSIYIAMYDKVASLGNGGDHVFDAISQCEQIHHDSADKEGGAPWRLFFRKELFTPWENWVKDPVATNLIFAQVVRGLLLGEYMDVQDSQMATIAAQQYFIEYGPDISEAGVMPLLTSYIPPDRIAEEQDVEKWAKLIIRAHNKLFANNREKAPERVKQEIIHYAKVKWAMAFSRYYDVKRLDRKDWTHKELCLAINWTGVFLLERGSTLYEIFYPQILSVSDGGTSDGQTIMFILVTGATLKFSCPDGEDIRHLVEFMLMGLKTRSTFAVAVQNHQGDGNDVSFREGDLIILTEPSIGKKKKPLVVTGTNDRTKQEGHMRTDHIYVLPTLQKPTEDILKMFQNRNINKS